jgi:hypothetical protein
MSIEDALKLLSEISDKRDEKKYNFVRHVLLMASGLLGILVSLHKTSSNGSISRICFALSLVLLTLGILFLTIALFGQGQTYKVLFRKWKEEIQAYIQQDNNQKLPKYTSINPKKVYSIFEILGYFSFCLSIICLTIYAILIA